MKIWIFIYYFNGTASAVPFLFIGGRFDYNAEQGEGVTHTLVRKGADYLTLTLIRAKFNYDNKSEIIKMNISRNVLGADLTMQKANIDIFADMCKTWGNSGLFSKK